MKSAANNLNHFSVNSFWCFNLFILIFKKISLAKVLYLPFEHNYLGPTTPYVSLPMNCPAQLHSERKIYQLFKYLQLRLWFYDGPNSTEVELVLPNLGHTFPIVLFCHLYYSFWRPVNQFSKLICLKTSPKIIKSDRFLTRLVFWLFHVTEALPHNWWWEHVAGDNQETWISLTVPICPLGGFSRSWDLVFASSLFVALLLSCWNSLTIFLR